MLLNVKNNNPFEYKLFNLANEYCAKKNSALYKDYEI